MAKKKAAKASRRKPVLIKVKERKSWNALIRKRFQEVPEWWKKKYSDLSHLVMEACGLKEKPKHDDLARNIAKDLIYNEKRKQKKKQKKAREEQVSQIRQDVAQDPHLNEAVLSAADQVQLDYEEPIEGARPVEELARRTFHDSPLRNELEKRIEERDARIQELEDVIRVQKQQQEARDERDRRYFEQGLKGLEGSGAVDWDGKFQNYIHQVSVPAGHQATRPC